MATTINYDGTDIRYEKTDGTTTIGYGNTILNYRDGDVSMETQKKLCVNRGWLLFGGNRSDYNHAI